MLEINLSNLKNNLNAIRKTGKNVMCVVKNDAYGCGAVEVSKYLIELGVEMLYVNAVYEAKELLENGICSRILVHNSFEGEDFALLSEYHNLEVTINSINDCQQLLKYALYSQVKVHLQIDTKMNRLGIKSKDDFLEIINILENNHNIIIEGIYTHFASPDSMEEQLEKFKEFANLYEFSMVHCAASVTYQKTNYGNWIRIGLELYDLNQVISVKTKPIEVRQLKKNESLGYFSQFTAVENCKIAVLPIGYGDGYRRSLEGFYVYANGKYYNIVGRICMNHIFVLIDESITRDSIFELTSPNLPASKLAEYLKTSNYEIYTMFKVHGVEYVK